MGYAGCCQLDSQFYRGKSFEAYLQDRMLQLAIERGLEIIGEAARNISLEFQLKHTEIPWKGIIGQRNVLAHEYGAIRPDLIWEVVSIDLPDLVSKLELLVPKKPQEDDE